MTNSLETGRFLAAIVLILLLLVPVLVYPVKALNINKEKNKILELNYNITESIVKNLSVTHSYLKTLSNLAKLSKLLEENKSNLENLNNTKYNLSKIALPALKLLGQDRNNSVIEYAYRYVLLDGSFSPGQGMISYDVKWFDNNQTVRYNPQSPSDSVFGGDISHNITIIINKNEPSLRVDSLPSNINEQEIRSLFMNHVHFDTYIVTYKAEGDAIKAYMDKYYNGSTFAVKDLSLYYGLFVTETYDNDFINAIKYIVSTADNYIIFAVANVSFTVNLVPGRERSLATASSWGLEDRTLNISEYVKAALRVLEDQISSAPASLIPDEVKSRLLAEIQNWSMQKYWIKTRHAVERINFTWIVTDEYTIYENGSNIGSGTDVVLTGAYSGQAQNGTDEQVAGLVLGEANQTLAQYYPGGLKAFTYEASGAPSAILILDGTTGSLTPLSPGQSSRVMQMTNASLLFSVYPISAGNGQRMASVVLDVAKDRTDDYVLNIDNLRGEVQYTHYYNENNKTYIIDHKYVLNFYINPVVWEVRANLSIKSYDMKIIININPIIIGKKMDVIEGNATSLIPALAPLGGDGLFDLIKGSADGVNFDILTNAVGVVQSIMHNKYLGWVLPTYFPAPMPSKLRIFAPGEYIGAYYMPPKIKLGIHGSFLKKLIAHFSESFFSVMYEKVTLTLKRPNIQGDDPNVGIVVFNKGRLKKSSSDSIHFYSLGFGAGEIRGKVIGPRFYATPTSTGLPGDTPPGLVSGFLNSSVVRFLTGDNIVTSIFDKLIPGHIFSTSREIVDNMRRYGLYPQITPYFGGKDSVWPYFLISPKSTARFVVAKPGDYVMKADAKFKVVNFRIVTIKIKIKIGPFKVKIKIKSFPIVLTVSSHSTASTVIHVRQIKALPLLVNYVVKPPDGTGTTLGPNTRSLKLAPNQFGEGSYIGIYAVPVWVDLDGVTPLGPVLFRGQYGVGENATSLTIAVVSPYGKVINGTDVRFFGVPLSFVRVPLNELERVVSGPEGSLVLMAAWKHGRTVSTIGSPGAATVLRVARVKSFSLFFYDGKMITYTGVYDPYNKIHEFAKQIENRVDYYAGVVQGYLGQANSTLLQIIGQINNIQDMLALINSKSGDIKDIIYNITKNLFENIINYMSKIIQELLAKFVTNAVAAVVGAVASLIPGWGTIASYITDIIKEIVNKAIDKFLSPSNEEQINVTDLITKYGLQVLTFVALKVAYDMIGYKGLMKVLEQVKGVAMKGIDMITRVNQSINYILKIVNNTVEMTKYKPIVLSKLNVYSLRGQEVPSEGILAKLAGSRGEHLILPIDAVEVNLSGGGVLYASPYSTLTFVLQLVAGAETGEYPNVAVSVQDALLYVAAWANFLAGFFDGSGRSTLMNIYDMLLQFSGRLTLTLSNVQQWVEIPGIDTHTILLPSTTLVPPSKI